MGDDPGCNNIQKQEGQTVLQNYLHDEDKGVREETIFLLLDWILFCTISTRRMKLSWKLRNYNEKL